MKRQYSILIQVIILSLLIGCSNDRDEKPAVSERSIVQGVSVGVVIPAVSKEYYETTGRIVPRNHAGVASRIMAEVREIRVKAGDVVKGGDVLALLSSPEIDARVAVAREAMASADRALAMAVNDMKLAGRTFARYNELFQAKAVSGQEFDEVRTKRDASVLRKENAGRSLAMAEARLKEAEAYRTFTVLSAPFDGVVAEKRVDEGSMASPGTVMFVIDEPVYRIEADVDESLVRYIKKGTIAHVNITVLNVSFESSISEIVNDVNRETATYRVSLDVPGMYRNLRGGILAVVRFPVAGKTYITVPELAIVKRGALRGVYVINRDGVLRFRLIKTGASGKGMVRVLAGLQANERIVIKGTEKAVDGGRLAQ